MTTQKKIKIENQKEEANLMMKSSLKSHNQAGEYCEFCYENYEVLNECVIQKFLLGVENQRLIKIYKESKEENEFLSSQLAEILDFVENNFLLKQQDTDHGSVDETRVQEIYKFNGENQEEDIFKFYGSMVKSCKSEKNYEIENSRGEISSHFLEKSIEKFIKETQEKNLIEKFLLSAEIDRLKLEFIQNYNQLHGDLNNSLEEAQLTNHEFVEKMKENEKKIELLTDKILEQREQLEALVEELEMKNELVEISSDKIMALETDNQKLQRQLNKTLSKNNSPNSKKTENSVLKSKYLYSPSTQSYIDKVETEGLKKRIKVLEKRLFEQTKEKSSLNLKLSKIKQRNSDVSFLQTPCNNKKSNDILKKDTNSASSIPFQNSFFKNQRDDLMKIVEDQWTEIKALERGKMELIEKNINLSKILSMKKAGEGIVCGGDRTLDNLQNWKKLSSRIDDYLVNMEKGSVNLEEGMDESLVIKRNDLAGLRRVVSEGVVMSKGFF